MMMTMDQSSGKWNNWIYFFFIFFFYFTDFSKTLINFNNQNNSFNQSTLSLPNPDIDWSVFENAGMKIKIFQFKKKSGNFFI